MGLLSKSFGSVVHNDNARYHDHDSISQVPLMTDETDRNFANDPPIYTPDNTHSDPESGILLRTVPSSSINNDNNTLAGHRHCDACLQQAERRENRRQQKSCCRWVALVFIVLIVCASAIGIVAVVLH